LDRTLWALHLLNIHFLVSTRGGICTYLPIRHRKQDYSTFIIDLNGCFLLGVQNITDKYTLVNTSERLPIIVDYNDSMIIIIA